MFVASTELLNIVSLHVCREQASSVDTDLSILTDRFAVNFRVLYRIDWAYAVKKISYFVLDGREQM